MGRFACLPAALLLIGSYAPARAPHKEQEPSRRPPDGVYAVLRASLKEQDVRPLKGGEGVVVHRHRYLKKDDKEPPCFVVVRAVPDVALDLAGEPKAVKDGEGVVRVLLKMRPKAALALERLTTDRLGKQIVIVLGGEVVTMHKIRNVIKDGDVQITSCAAGAANYLLEQLQAHEKNK
jgi:hypothetical protein